MELKKIITRRELETWPSWDLVFEWEDIISHYLNLDLISDKRIRYNNYYKKLPLFLDILKPNKCSLVFEMKPQLINNRNNIKQIIPYIIDFYLKGKTDLQLFYSSYNKCPFVIISSFEVYNYLQQVSCPLHCIHLALSISDRYKINTNTRFEKPYDIVLMGRQNKVLLSYLEKYLGRSHQKILYIYRKQEGERFNYYSSDGEKIGDINTREKYITLLRKSKICFFSTPGIDGGEKRTNGFNQVTPRFLEFVSAGCHIIARYKQNADTDYFELSKFSPSVESFEDFEIMMDKCLNTEVDMDFYSNYLKKHYTSQRCFELNNIMMNL